MLFVFHFFRVWADPVCGHIPTPAFLPRGIPWTGESGRLESMGSQRVGHNSATNTLAFTFSQDDISYQRDQSSEGVVLGEEIGEIEGN